MVDRRADAAALMQEAATVSEAISAGYIELQRGCKFAEGVFPSIDMERGLEQ